MTDQVGKDTGPARRGGRGSGALAAVLSLLGRGASRLAGWWRRSHRWALGGAVLVVLLAAAWASLLPWVSNLRSGPSGLDLRDGWLGWDFIERGEPVLPEGPRDADVLTPVDPSLIRVSPAPVPLEPPEAPQVDESFGLSAAASGVASSQADESVSRGPAVAAVAASEGSDEPQRVDLRGNLRFPADGPVVRELGWYRHPTYGDWRFYPGVEIQLRPGSAVHPALAGRVAKVEDDVRWALTVWVDHGSGWQTSYGYLREARVSPGQAVDVGDVLGISGLSPLGEPQIMFAVWKDGEPVDPARLMR